MAKRRMAGKWFGRSVRAGRAVNGGCRAEELERRVLLSSAIAAFGAQQTIGTGGSAWAVAAGDLNGDGKADLVYSNFTSGNVGVMLGNGDGTFRAISTLSVGSAPRGVTLADVNRDGRLDLLTANEGDNTIGVLLGNRDGTFAARPAVPADGVLFTVTVADVNGDGKPDLLAPGVRAHDDLNVMLGNGDGSFKARATFATGALSPGSTAVIGDFNRDGKLDVAISSGFPDKLGLLTGNGDGTFGALRTLSASGPVGLAAGDLNADGKLDLVYGSQNLNAGVALGNGDGTFAAAQTLAAPANPYAVALADVNGDGRLDVVETAFGGGGVSVLLGNGDGTLAAPKVFATGASPRDMVVGDWNGDGRPDIATANFQGNSLSVLLGDVPPVVVSIDRTTAGPITSSSTLSWLVTFNEPVTGVDATDFVLAGAGVTTSMPVVVNGSGAAYTVTASGVSGTGAMGLNVIDDGSIRNGAGNPLQPGGMAAFQVRQISGAGSVVVTADVNGDGIPDLVQGEGTISVELGNGDATFQAPVTYLTTGVYSIAVSDINGDGRPDLILAENGGVGILLGNGGGTFKARTTFAAGAAPISVTVSDVNRDGRPDVIVGARRSGTVGVLLGKGNGEFQPLQTFEATGLKAISVCDVNGDGIPDVVVLNAYPYHTLGVLLGNGDGEFRAQKTLTAPNFDAYSLAVADMNGDGKVDLVVSLASFSRVAVLLGKGDGTFLSPQTMATDAVPVSVAVGDLNGDGKLDVVAANRFGNDVSVLLGNGNGSLRAQQTFDAGVSPSSVSLSDLNGDGRVDVVEARNGSSTLTALIGATDGGFVGQVYTVVPLIDVMDGTQNADQITLLQDPDHVHIDWKLGSTTAQVAMNELSGLTINGNGGDDVITLDYTNGSPLPDRLHLNGSFTLTGTITTWTTFTVGGLFGDNPLSNKAIELGRSTLYISYADGPTPLGLIRQALSIGYNGGAWNGATGPNGAITSAGAAGGAAGVYGIGYADSADGIVAGQPANTVEIRYTVMGDANLDRVVNSTDAILMARNYMIAGRTAWDLGNFNYDTAINLSDAMILQKNFNVSATGTASPAVLEAASSAPVTMPVVSLPVVGASSPGDALGDGEVGKRGQHKPPKRLGRLGGGRDREW